MNNYWCPYTGKFWGLKDTEEDHIIPLTLGGHNSLTIKANKKENWRLSTLLEQKFLKVHLISSARKYYGLIGHRKVKPHVAWETIMGNLKGILDLSSDKIRYKTYRKQNPYSLNIDITAPPQRVMQSLFNFDTNLMLAFACKIALGVSYFFYADAFKKFGYHAELRSIMNSDNPFRELKFIQANNKGRGLWAIPYPYSLSSQIPVWWTAIFDIRDKHLIFTLHCNSEIILGISLFGHCIFRWYFNISNKSAEFPIGKASDLGNVIVISLPDKKITQYSLRNYLEAFLDSRLRSQIVKESLS